MYDNIQECRGRQEGTSTSLTNTSRRCPYTTTKSPIGAPQICTRTLSDFHCSKHAGLLTFTIAKATTTPHAPSQHIHLQRCRDCQPCPWHPRINDWRLPSRRRPPGAEAWPKGVNRVIGRSGGSTETRHEARPISQCSSISKLKSLAPTPSITR